MLVGCVDDPGARAKGAPGGGHVEQPPVPVAVKPAKIGSIASLYTATSTLEVEKEAEVVARVSGVIQSIEVEEGASVNEGDVLLRLHNDEYRLLHEKARANAENLRSRYERLESIADGVVSAEEFETARNERATAESEEALAALNLSYTVVRAPFAGRVTRRLVDEGQNVTPNTPVFVVADFEPLLARVHVPAKEFGELRTDQDVELVLNSSGVELTGRIKLISPVIDPSTGTIKVTVEVPQYPPETRPGDFVEVHIVTAEHPSSTLVPRNAVITDRGEPVVFVVEEDVAVRRVVEVGFTDDESAEITHAISPGESIVVRGQRSLEHGAAVKVRPDRVPEVSAERSGQDR